MNGKPNFKEPPPGFRNLGSHSHGMSNYSNPGPAGMYNMPPPPSYHPVPHSSSSYTNVSQPPYSHYNYQQDHANIPLPGAYPFAPTPPIYPSNMPHPPPFRSTPPSSPRVPPLPPSMTPPPLTPPPSAHNSPISHPPPVLSFNQPPPQYMNYPNLPPPIHHQAEKPPFHYRTPPLMPQTDYQQHHYPNYQQPPPLFQPPPSFIPPPPSVPRITAYPPPFNPNRPPPPPRFPSNLDVKKPLNPRCTTTSKVRPRNSSTSASNRRRRQDQNSEERNQLLEKWRKNYCETTEEIAKKLLELANEEKDCWVRSSPADIYYIRKSANVVKATPRLEALCKVFEEELIQRASKVREQQSPFTLPTPKRKHRVCKHKCKYFFKHECIIYIN